MGYSSQLGVFREHAGKETIDNDERKKQNTAARCGGLPRPGQQAKRENANCPQNAQVGRRVRCSDSAGNQ